MLRSLVKRLLVEESGQDTIEWVLITLLISLAAATIMFALGINIEAAYQETDRQVTDAIDMTG